MALSVPGTNNDAATLLSRYIFTVDEAPDATTHAGSAPSGALLIRTDTVGLYQNTGTQETPSWSEVGGA